MSQYDALERLAEQYKRALEKVIADSDRHFEDRADCKSLQVKRLQLVQKRQAALDELEYKKSGLGRWSGWLKGGASQSPRSIVKDCDRKIEAIDATIVRANSQYFASQADSRRSRNDLSEIKRQLGWELFIRTNAPQLYPEVTGLEGKADQDGKFQLYFSVDGGEHAHYTLGPQLDFVYRREPGSRRGYHNYQLARQMVVSPEVRASNLRRIASVARASFSSRDRVLI